MQIGNLGMLGCPPLLPFQPQIPQAEELLIGKDQIEILAALDPCMGPSGAPIWPFAALVREYAGSWSPDEVDHTFTIPLTELSERVPEIYETRLTTVCGEDFPFEMIPGGRHYTWRSKKNPVFFYRGGPEIIWGVTARILYEFLERYKKTD